MVDSSTRRGSPGRGGAQQAKGLRHTTKAFSVPVYRSVLIQRARQLKLANGSCKLLLGRTGGGETEPDEPMLSNVLITIRSDKNFLK